MRSTLLVLLTLMISALAAGLLWRGKDNRLFKPIEELKVRITSSIQVPDPTNIASAGDWYYLDHISSGLVAFDSNRQRFEPMMSDKWDTRANGTHVFPLRPGASFHEGTPITVKDVIWSIKRQLIRKTATHFRFWKYIKGCENLKSLTDDCEGLFAISEHEVGIKLTDHSESFYLQMASPETGIFFAGDMNPKTADLKPTKFSGPYYVDKVEEGSALLKRNEYSFISARFPNSPRSIRIVKVPLSKVDAALTGGQIDFMIRSYRPLGENDWGGLGFGILETTNSSILYLYGTGSGTRKKIGQDFLEKLWSINKDSKINPADSFLPFAGTDALKKSEFLHELPEHSDNSIRILCPVDFFSQEFLAQISSAARSVGTSVEFEMLPPLEWLAAFDDPKASEKYDYILSSYAASERYPTVQLRYLAGEVTNAPVDLDRLDSPDNSSSREEILRTYEKWLLQTRRVIPLFFNRTILLFKKDLDLGDQSKTDAEIELWRVQEKVLK